MKINIWYQYLVFLISLGCLVFGYLEKDGLLMGLGSILLVGATGTIFHVRKKQYVPGSKLPKDINV